MPTLAEEEASEESDNEEESEDVFNELVDRLRKVALEAQVCLKSCITCPLILIIPNLRLQKKN